jgi:hypothetical protein
MDSDEVFEHLAWLDDTRARRVALLMGVTLEELEELGGVAEDEVK